MASRKDVAKLAGVSPASVSYYINGNGYVSDKAKKKIKSAIEELDYTPNLIARSLKTKDSKQFLLFCNEIRNPFYSELVYRATKKAFEYGYTTMFTNVGDNDEYTKNLSGYQLSGVFAANTKISLDLILQMAKRNLPIVILRDVKWENLPESITEIYVDYSYIMKDILNHLEDENYKDIVYVSGAISQEIGKTDEKTESFIRTRKCKREDIIYNITSSEDAREYIIKNYSKTSHPDAFVCTNDAVAVGVLKGIQDLGLKIPDIGVVGFDNSINSKLATPSLTSVDIDMEKVGEIVIDLLVRKLHGENPENYILYPKLIIRESTIRKGNYKIE